MLTEVFLLYIYINYSLYEWLIAVASKSMWVGGTEYSEKVI
jgi:hypothetical protein